MVVSLADARGKLPIEKLLEMKLDARHQFDHLPTVYEQYTGKIAVENLRPSWLIFSEGFRQDAVPEGDQTRLRRHRPPAAMLLVLAPVMAAVAAAGEADFARAGALPPGPGRPARPRVHHPEVPVDAGGCRSGDRRGLGHAERRPAITPVGRLIRRSRLDELPQLWNVLVGDMSLIGPRPERPEFVEMLTQRIPFYGERHVVKPGLTGWAQVRYTYGASVEDAMEKLQYDLFYMKHMSLALDLVIVFETVKTVHPQARRRVSTEPHRPEPVMNALTIDVEDYFHVSVFDGLVPRSRVGSSSRAASVRTPSVCSRSIGETQGHLFRARLGRRTVSAPGPDHRRAPATRSPRTGSSTGWSTTRPPRAFREDVHKAKAVLEEACGREVIGYRAPSYSITPQSLWALDILIEEGYRYDSSIFPIRHDRYGIPLSPRHPYLLHRGGGLAARGARFDNACSDR